MKKKILLLVPNEDIRNLLVRKLEYFSGYIIAVKSVIEAKTELGIHPQLRVLICAFGGYPAGECENIFQPFLNSDLTIVSYGDMPTDYNHHTFFNNIKKSFDDTTEERVWIEFMSPYIL